MKLVLSWIVVILALGWGVTKTAQKAAPLFKSPAAKAP